MAFQLARVNVPTLKYDYPLQEHIALLKERAAMADNNTEKYYKAKGLLSELISQIPEEDRDRPEIANEINAIEGGIEHLSGRLARNEAPYMRGDINMLSSMMANIPNTALGRYAQINTEYNKRRQAFVDKGGNADDFDLLNPRENLWNAAKNNTQVTMTTPVDRPDFFADAVTTVGQITPDVTSYQAGISRGGTSTRNYSNASVDEFANRTESIRNVTRSQIMQIQRMRNPEYFRMFGGQKAIVGEKMGQPVYYGIVVDPETNLPKMKDGEVVYGETFDPEMAVSRPEYEALKASEMALQLHRRHAKIEYVNPDPKDPAKGGRINPRGRINPNDPEEDDKVNILPTIKNDESEDEKLTPVNMQAKMFTSNLKAFLKPPSEFSDKHYAETSADLEQELAVLEKKRTELVALGGNIDPRDMMDVDRQIAALNDQKESLENLRAAIEDGVRDAMDPEEYKLATGKPFVREERSGAAFSKGGYGMQTNYSSFGGNTWTRDVIRHFGGDPGPEAPVDVITRYEKAKRKYDATRKAVIHDLERSNKEGHVDLTDKFTHSQDKAGQAYLADLVLNEDVNLEDYGFETDNLTAENIAKQIVGTKVNDNSVEVRFANGKTVLLSDAAKTEYLKYIVQSPDYNMDTRQVAAMHGSALSKRIAKELDQLSISSSPSLAKMMPRVITLKGHKLYVAKTSEGRLKFRIDKDEHWSHADYPHHIVQAFEQVIAD